MTESEREAKKLRKHLKELTTSVRRFVKLMDAEVLKPSIPERGRRIAAMLNGLEMANDSARHFGLGEELKVSK